MAAGNSPRKTSAAAQEGEGLEGAAVGQSPEERNSAMSYANALVDAAGIPGSLHMAVADAAAAAAAQRMSGSAEARPGLAARRVQRSTGEAAGKSVPAYGHTDLGYRSAGRTCWRAAAGMSANWEGERSWCTVVACRAFVWLEEIAGLDTVLGNWSADTEVSSRKRTCPELGLEERASGDPTSSCWVAAWHCWAPWTCGP